MSENKNQNNNNNFFNQNPIFTFLIFSIVIMAIFKLFMSPTGGSIDSIGLAKIKTKEVPYSDFKSLIKDKAISEVSIGNFSIKGLSDTGMGKTLYTTKRVYGDTEFIKLLDQNGVKYSAFTENTWLSDFIFSWVLPVLFFVAIWIFLTKRLQKNMGGGILGMGSKNSFVAEKPKVKFDDVAGVNESKEEVKEIVDFLKFPDRYIEIGAKIPKGVLLVGSPGTGKTLLAKAVAGEADVPFFSVVGSSFIEMFVGVGASRVRELFAQAQKEAPSIVFIDEIDAIGKSRAAGGIGGNDEREQTLNQLLSEMDGFDSSNKAPVIILAATNRPEILDPALLRPGRFDRQVLVDKPDFDGRVEILKVHAQSVKLGKDVDLEEIGRLTAGLSGADLANIINEAALLAGRNESSSVSQKDLSEAIERAIAGLEKKSRRINEKEKKIVTYHESGHALIAEITKGAKKVSKVSIVPRGLGALGYTMNKPEENRFLMQKYELLAEVDVLLGGRAAEEVFLDEISTGASNDLERATDILKQMVGMYGMSDVAGLMVLEKQANTFLGGPATSKEYSEETAKAVDSFVKTKLDERYEVVKESLKEYADAIEGMVELLYERENIEGKDVRDIIERFEKENGKKSKLEPLKEDKKREEMEVEKEQEEKKEK
jgi:cell division protease FtsH